MHWGENEISERTEKSSMSLAEVLAMKQETEEAILKELQLFQNNTGLNITGINTMKDMVFGSSTTDRIINISLTVEL